METGGRAAYRGFDYQIRVSVWLALCFLVEEKAADRVSIEPLVGEDLELLRAKDTKTETLGRPINITAAHTIVQVKGKSSGDWNPTHLDAIIAGPKKARKRASTRRWPMETMASDKDVRFLFITSGAVASGLTRFEVNRPLFEIEGRAVAAKGLPKRLVDAGDDTRRRIGIRYGCNDDTVHRETDRILTEVLKVPHGGRTACMAGLIERVRAAMLDRKASIITAEEIRAIARDHGGDRVGPESFVPPKSFGALSLMLQSKHAAFITGEAGFGKSTAAKQLMYEHASGAVPFHVVEPQTPGELSALASALEPTLAYVEDPFGRYSRLDGQNDWLAAMDAFVGAASRDRKLVVTTRPSFASQLTALTSERADLRIDALKKLVHRLNESDYDAESLLRAHLDRRADPSLITWLGGPVVRARIAAELPPRPLSFVTLVDRAARVPVRQQNDKTLARLIREANDEDLGNDVEETFRDASTEELLGLAVVWAAFEGWQLPPEALMQHLEDELRDRLAEVTSVCNTLRRLDCIKVVGGDHLETHPVFLKAFFRTLESRRVLRSLALERVIDVALRDGEDGVALRLIAATARVHISKDAQLNVTAFLRKRALVAAAAERLDDLGPMLEALSKHGAPADALTMLARALTWERPADAEDWEVHVFGAWTPPAWSDGDLARVTHDPAAAPIARAFIRSHFPTLPSFFDGADALASFLNRIADVSEEFDALLEHITDARDFTCEVIAHGAAQSRTADVDALVARAVGIEDATSKWWKTIDFLDEDDQAHRDYYGDEGFERVTPAFDLIDAVLEARARAGDRAWAANRTEPLVFRRFAERVRWKQEMDPAVVGKVIAACPKAELANLLGEAAGHDELLGVALSFLSNVPPAEWVELLAGDVLGNLSDEELPGRLALVATAMKGPVDGLHASDRIGVIHELSSRPATQTLASDLRVGRAAAEQEALDHLEGVIETATFEAAALLGQLAHSQLQAALAAAPLLAKANREVDPIIETWLAPDADAEHGVAALDAAAYTAKRSTWLLRGLGSPHADVRKRALLLLRACPPDEVDAAVAAVACGRTADKTPTVRIDAVLTLGALGSPAAQRALVSALSDRADTSDAARYRQQDEDHQPAYGVAVAAAMALEQLAPWTEETQASIREFLIEGTPAGGLDVQKPLVRGLQRNAS